MNGQHVVIGPLRRHLAHNILVLFEGNVPVEVIVGVDVLTLLHNLGMKVQARRQPAIAHGGYKSSSVRLHSRGHVNLVQLGIAGLVAEAVVDDNLTSVTPHLHLDFFHDAVSRGIYSIALGQGEIYSGMHPAPLEQGMITIAVRTAYAENRPVRQYGIDGGNAGGHIVGVGEHQLYLIVGAALDIGLVYQSVSPGEQIPRPAAAVGLIQIFVVFLYGKGGIPFGLGDG